MECISRSDFSNGFVNIIVFFSFFYRKSFQISYRAFFFPISTSNRDHLSSNFNFIFGGKKKSILRAESKKRNENTRIPLLSPFSLCTCTMISQSKFDIQQSGNTMNSKRNSNRTIFKLLGQFNFIEEENTRKKKIYIKFPIRAAFIVIITVHRRYLRVLSRSRSKTAMRKGPRYLDVSPPPPLPRAISPSPLPPSTLLF